MERIYLLTGANGHLGVNIVKQLVEKNCRVRALVLPGEETPYLEGPGVEVMYGDVRDKASLQQLFCGLEGKQVVVIHAAGIIDITSKVAPRTYDVNVNGTKNMISLALENDVHRFIHVSSVHAIPEPAGRRQIHEVPAFSAATVHGGYAKTKAEATQYVLDCTHHHGLPAVILQPAGIVGPMDSGNNNLVAVVQAYMEGKVPACPRGGYNLVDVRDVATTCIAAVDKGRVGESYILSGCHIEFTDFFDMLRDITGKKRNCPIVPLWMAKMAAPFLERQALRKGEKPWFTTYALMTIGSNDNFSHQKASRELDFWPRDTYDTLKDTVTWLLVNTDTQIKRSRRARRRKKARATA